MKLIFYIFILFFASTQITKSQDSIANTKFNYFEFNVNSANYVYTYFNKILYVPAPIYNISTPSFGKNIKSFNSLNIGAKLGHHKLSLGLELNPIYVLYNEDIQYNEWLKSKKRSLNFKLNYFFYFSKKQKKINHFIMLNFNTQKIKDYLNLGNTLNDFEYKKGYAYGLSYGISFYVKKNILIEPSLLFNTVFFKDKQIYTVVNKYTTSYVEEITPERINYFGIGLKLGYIIPFKNK